MSERENTNREARYVQEQFEMHGLSLEKGEKVIFSSTEGKIEAIVDGFLFWPISEKGEPSVSLKLLLDKNKPQDMVLTLSVALKDLKKVSGSAQH